MESYREVSDEIIEELKKKNDWGKEIDIEKCIRVKITRKKDLSPIDDEDIIELYKKISAKMIFQLNRQGRLFGFHG